jgi:hypothetical protein
MSLIRKVSVKQRAAYTIREYVDAGCEQLKGGADVIGLGIYAVTEGRMCDGCHAQPKCKAFVKLQGAPVWRAPIAPAETVRQEAARLGVSISEVRRRRAGA